METSVILLKSISNNPLTFPQLSNHYSQDPKSLLESQTELISGYNNLLQALYQIGNVEHSCDWDLYAIVKLNSGQEIFSATGYPDLVIQGDKLLIQIDDEDESGEGQDPNQYIPLSDIATISIRK